MKRLVLANFSVPDSVKPEFVDLAVTFYHHFIWGELPTAEELQAYLGPRAPDQDAGMHWSGFADWRQSDLSEYRDLALAEFCLRYEAVELWFDTSPYSQLQLIWLLDHFGFHPSVVARLKLRLLDMDLAAFHPRHFEQLRPVAVEVRDDELQAAHLAWQAYCASTPEACFRLLNMDLSALHLLKPALRDLLEELPSSTTGLGASEMRMLELIGRGYANVNPLFHLTSLRQARVFNEWELGYLLDGLAFGPRPAIAGLDEELRMLGPDKLGGRHKAMLRSRLSLTGFGREVMAGREDFSRQNPIDRWWGGTHLTNKNLWRFDPVLNRP